MYLGYRVGAAVTDVDVDSGTLLGKDNVDLSQGVLIGYQFASPWAAEVFWQDAGNAEVLSGETGNTSGIADISLLGAGAVYRYASRPVIELYAEAGLASLFKRYQYAELSDEDEVVLYLGGGVRWSPRENWQLRVGYTFYSPQVQVATVGIVRHFRFGSRPEAVSLAAPETASSPPMQCKDFTLDFDGIEFNRASVELTDESIARLDNLARQLRLLPADIDIEIRAYADEDGAESYNYALSLVRARTVRDYLASQGIALSRIKAEGYGEWALPGENRQRLPSGHSRRAELTLLGIEKYVGESVYCQSLVRPSQQVDQSASDKMQVEAKGEGEISPEQGVLINQPAP